MSATFRKMVRYFGGGARYRTHPYIAKSTVSDLTGIDPLARVTRSHLHGAVTLGAHCVLDECRVTANESVAVGTRSILSGPIRIVADLNPVTIGKFCSIAPDVAVWESLHNDERMSTFFVLSEIFGDNFRRDLASKGPVWIGSDVWIGVRAIVLSGVTIGDGAVIGAGAVVTRDIPPYAIAVGSPAVVVRQRFSEPICRRLADLRWWDWDDERLRRNRVLFDGKLTADLLDRIQ